MTDEDILNAALKVGEANATTSIRFALRIRALRRAMVSALMSLRSGNVDNARRKLEKALDDD